MSSLFFPEKEIVPICPKCNHIPFISISTTIPDTFNIKCPCSYDKEISSEKYIKYINEQHSNEKCQYKKEHCNLNGNRFCYQCNKWLCSDCVKSHMKSNKFHLLSINKFELDTKCVNHIEKDTAMYCFSCHVYYCDSCALAHKAHQCVNVKEEYKDYLNENQMKLYAKSITKAERYINTYNKKLKDDVIKLLHELIDKIEISYKKNYDINRNVILLSKYFLNLQNETKCVNFSVLYNIINNVNFKFEKVKDFSYEETSSKNINNLLSHYDKVFLYDKVDNPFESTNCISIQNEPKEIKIQPLATLSNLSSKIKSMTFLKDGRLAVASEPYIKIFDLTLMKTVLTIKNEFEQEIECISQLENGLLASGSKDKMIKLFNIKNSTYTTEAIIVGHQYRVTKIISIDNELFASSSYDHTIKIWRSISPYDEVRTLTGHDEAVFSILKLKSKNEIVSGSTDIRFWNLSNYQCEAVLKGINCFFADSLIEIDSQRLLVGEKIVTSIINLKTYQIEQKIKDGLFRMTSFNHVNSNMNWFLCGNKMGNIFLMENDIGSIRQINKVDKAHRTSIVSIIDIGNGNFASVAVSDKQIKIWSIQ